MWRFFVLAHIHYKRTSIQHTGLQIYTLGALAHPIGTAKHARYAGTNTFVTQSTLCIDTVIVMVLKCRHPANADKTLKLTKCHDNE